MMVGLLIVLRLIHIFSGVFWAGTSFFFISFITPTVAATGPEGQKFIQHLSFRTRFITAMFWAAVLSVVSGLALMWQISGFRLSWFGSGYGLFLGLGGLAGLGAFTTGYLLQNRNSRRMKELAMAMQAAGGPPSPEQIGQMQMLAAKVAQGGQITSVFLAVALVGMSAAQYVFL